MTQLGARRSIIRKDQMSRANERRRESEDGEKGMDIDAITESEDLGGMLSRMSICDPYLQNWADRMNSQSPSGGADGNAVGGTKKAYRQSPHQRQTHCSEEHP